MAEAKVFPMSTFVACLRGGEAADQGLLDMLSFVTESEVDPDVAPVAAGIAKGWIYEQNPELTKYKEGDIAGLGQKVKLAPLPEDEAAQAQKTLAVLAELKAAKAELETAKAELEQKVKTLEADVAVMQGKLKTFEDQAAQGDVKVNMSISKIEDMTKKLEDLQAEVEKVKSQGVVVAGAAGGEGAAAEGGEGPGEPASEAGDDFGFTGGGDDPFADSAW